MIFTFFNVLIKTSSSVVAKVRIISIIDAFGISFGRLVSAKMDVLCPRGIETTCRSWRANYRSSGAGGDTWKLQRGTAALKWAVLSDLSR